MPIKVQPAQHAMHKFVSLLRLDNLKTRIVAIYILNVFDLIATTLWVSLFGIEVEANPLARWMYSTNSIYLFKAAIVAFGCYILHRYLPRHPKYMWTSWALLTIYSAIAIYHCVIAMQLLSIFGIL